MVKFDFFAGVSIKNVGSLDVNVCGTASYAYDNNYGADADGNRGTFTDWVEDIDIKTIHGLDGESYDEKDIEDRDRLYKIIEENICECERFSR